MSTGPNNDDSLNFMASMLEEMRSQMATRGDLVQLETRFVNKLEAEASALRGDIEQVSLRLDSIERALTARLSQIEA